MSRLAQFDTLQNCVSRNPSCGKIGGCGHVKLLDVLRVQHSICRVGIYCAPLEAPETAMVSLSETLMPLS